MFFFEKQINCFATMRNETIEGELAKLLQY